MTSNLKKNAVVAQLVEHQLPKLRVTSSSLAYRSIDNQALTAKSRCFFIEKNIINIPLFMVLDGYYVQILCKFCANSNIKNI